MFALLQRRQHNIQHACETTYSWVCVCVCKMLTGTKPASSELQEPNVSIKNPPKFTKRLISIISFSQSAVKRGSQLSTRPIDCPSPVAAAHSRSSISKVGQCAVVREHFQGLASALFTSVPPNQIMAWERACVRGFGVGTILIWS